MLNQLKKSGCGMILSAGLYRLQQWKLENQLKREVRRLIREERAA